MPLEALDKPQLVPLDRQEAISSYEPSFYEQKIKPVLQKLGFIQTREERVAYAMNVYSEAKQRALEVTKDNPEKTAEVTKQLIPVIRDNWDDYVEQTYGLYTPARANKKMEQVMLTAGIASAGLASPVQTLVGIGTFAGLKGAAGATIYPAIQYFNAKIKNEPYYYKFINDPAELLPEEASSAAEGIVNLIELIGLGGISAGISRKYPKLWEAMTKETITKYNMPKDVYISPEKIKSVYQTGEAISPEEMDLYQSLGLTGKQVKTALQQGVNVKVPAEKVVSTVDKPYWAKIKGFFGVQPFETVQTTPAWQAQPAKAALPGPGQVEPSIYAEARKYKSAEEFVKAKANLFHGTDSIFNIFDLNKSKAFGESKFGHWFTDSKDFAAMFGENVKSASITFKNPKVISIEKWNDIRMLHAKDGKWFKNWKQELLQQGYDGLLVKGEEETFAGQKIPAKDVYAAFEDKQVTSESQLIDIWKKAHAEQPRTSGTEKAVPGATSAEKIETDPVKKVIEALKGAKSARGQQEKLYKKARGEKLAKMMAVGEKTKGEAGFYAEKGSLKGELPKAEFESIRGAFKQEEIDELFNMVKDSPHISPWDKITAREGLANLFGETGGKVPTKSELKMLHKVFGAEFTEALLAKRDLMEKIKEAGYQVVNVPRAIMSSFDLSFGLRQGSFAAPRYRQEFFDSWKKQFRWFKSDKAYLETMKIISENPNYELAVESGVSFTEMDSIMTEREELFASQWAEKIPVVGRGVRASARAYTAFANKFRMDIFDSMVQDAEALGLDPQSNADLTKQIADLVNSATGRGDLGQFERAALALNAFFFSPRLMASRVGLLTKLLQPSFYTTQTPYVRKEYLKILLTWLGTGMTIATLAKLAGADVGIDSRSSDFGKIKIGPTRIDVWGGFQQYVRMAAQLISGEYISSTTGKKLTLGEGYKPLTRLDILYHQLEGKEAPIFSLATRMLKGQDITGKKVSFTKELALRFVPMVIQDLYDVIKENPKAVWTSILSPFGVGVQTYSDKKRLK